MPADRTPTELAELIRADTSIDLTAVQQHLAPVIDGTASLTPDRAKTIRAPSIELDDVTVTISAWYSDPSYLGTFDRTAGTTLIQIAIDARPNDPWINGGPPPPVELPHREQIAWVRVVLGGLADYAYRIVTDMRTLRDQPGFFIVLVDRNGTPRLAASDFAWLLVSGGGRRAYPEKLVPEDPDLLRYLRRNGDLINVDRVAHPQASPPAVWAQEFVSHLTATIADELGRGGNTRSFTFEEIRLVGDNQVIVRYIWHLVEGGKKYGFDIDLAGIRAHGLEVFDDPRAITAARSVGVRPFRQPVFQKSEVMIDGVTWVKLGGFK
ncbi:hypothetical protein [Rhodococcus sp. Q]|uniref:hypothetical protein n=1 Tax=Rhodococcus sp. Q TaxID=2502252 RepID=UPI0020165EC5|nr:hypothetical protein [Rhodococcus sp. Q]